MSRQRKVFNKADDIYGSLSSSDWWSPHDDRLLIQAAERGYNAERILKTVKFSVPFTRKEISSRWNELLYDEEVAKRVAPMVLKVARITLKRVPWRKNEDKIIKKALKDHGFVSFAHILHIHRNEFHCSRTVSSLESHYWSLKKRGTFDNIDIHRKKRGDTHQQFEYMLPDTPEKSKKKMAKSKKKKRNESDDEEDIFSFHKFREKASSKKKKKSNTKKTVKRNARKAVKLETILKLNKPMNLSQIPPNVFAYLDGMNCRLFITKRNTSVGKKMKSITPDLDLSLEGNAHRCVGRQAFIKLFSKKISNSNNFEHYFEVTNLSKKSLFVGDYEVCKDMSRRLVHGDVISFPTSIRFKFCEIRERIDRMRIEKNKVYPIFSDSKPTNLINGPVPASKPTAPKPRIGMGGLVGIGPRGVGSGMDGPVPVVQNFQYPIHRPISRPKPPQIQAVTPITSLPPISQLLNPAVVPRNMMVQKPPE